MDNSSSDDIESDAEPMNRYASRKPEKPKDSSSNITISNAENVVLEGTLNVYRETSKKAKGRKYVGIVWDIFTCPVPQGKSTLDLIEKMRSRFITEGYKEKTFISLCDMKNESNSTIEDLDEGKVTVRPVVANEKDKIDCKLKESIKQFSEGGVSGKRLVVVSDYVNFDDLITYIKTTKIPEVFLVHKDVASKAVLEYSEADHIQFSTLTHGLRDAKNNEAKITGVPDKKEKQNIGGDQMQPKKNSERTDPKMRMEHWPNSRESTQASHDIVTDAERIIGAVEISELIFYGDGLNNQTNWKRGKLIGSGGFGKVYEVEGIPLHRFVAVKQVQNCQQDSEEEASAIIKEIEILKNLSHDRIVKFYGFSQTEGVLSLFMERITGGSLKKHLNDNSKSPLDTSRIRAITRQMLEGVSYLHLENIVHKDIKSGNVLMDGHFQIKLADFGVSIVFQEMSKSTTKRIGTIRWMAPERFDHSKKCSFEVDIWATGCTVIEMLTRKCPFPNLKDEAHIIGHLLGSNPSPAYDLPESCPKEMMEFFTDIFQKDVSKRPTAKDLLCSHPFVKCNN